MPCYATPLFSLPKKGPLIDCTESENRRHRMLNDSAASKRKPKERNVKDLIIAFILVSMAKIMKVKAHDIIRFFPT